MPTYLLYIYIYTLCLNFCVCKKYYNYTLFRSIPVNENHMEFLENMASIYDANFWRPPGLMYRPVDFIVAPEDKSAFLNDAEKLGVYLTTIIEDVQKALDMQTVKTYIRRNMMSFDWNNFFRLDDIYEWLKDLAMAHPNEMTLQSIGKSYENREIMSVKIVLKGSKLRSKVIVEGGIHAREWIAPAFVTYMLHQILTAPQSDNELLKSIASTYEWYFVPVLNPDGYEFTFKEDRLWRKNRNNEHGVDLNRNFANAFGTIGVSHRKTSETYCGTHAFSERESSAMANFVRGKSTGLEYYLAFHSYGQLMVIPYAHTMEHVDNFDEVKNMCNEAKSKIASKYNTQYSSGTAYDTVGYSTSGVSGCWVKREFRVPYVITFELRDNGYDGFALSPKKIMPTCQETMDGVLSLLTPRTSEFMRLRGSVHIPSGQGYNVLEKIVIVFNAFLFIIVRFD